MRPHVQKTIADRFLPMPFSGSVPRICAVFPFCCFPPFAEEGFTCLDHSAMSKKKKKSVLLFSTPTCLSERFLEKGAVEVPLCVKILDANGGICAREFIPSPARLRPPSLVGND